MTKLEKNNVVRVVAAKIKELDDAYPDVGWGKSWISCVDGALAELGWKRSDVDYEALKVRNPR